MVVEDGEVVIIGCVVNCDGDGDRVGEVICVVQDSKDETK